MTSIQTEEFFADGKCIRKCTGSIIREIFDIILAVVCLVLWYFAGKMQKMYALASFFEYPDEYYLWRSLKYLLIGLVVVIAITTPFILTDAIIKQRKLAHTYLAISATTVSGIHFPTGRAGSRCSFVLPLNEITTVHAVPGRKARTNLEIYHHTGIYKVFAIADAERAADMIMERKGLLMASYAAGGYANQLYPGAAMTADNAYADSASSNNMYADNGYPLQ